LLNLAGADLGAVARPETERPERGVAVLVNRRESLEQDACAEADKPLGPTRPAADQLRAGRGAVREEKRSLIRRGARREKEPAVEADLSARPGRRRYFAEVVDQGGSARCPVGAPDFPIPADIQQAAVDHRIGL